MQVPVSSESHCIAICGPSASSLTGIVDSMPYRFAGEDKEECEDDLIDHYGGNRNDNDRSIHLHKSADAEVRRQ